MTMSDSPNWLSGDLAQPLVSVIVVSFNSAQVIGHMLAPLYGVPWVEVIVVDNDSQDQTVPLLHEEFPEVGVIQNGANLGFARAVNSGAAAAKGRHYLLLNPDAVITPGALQILVDALDRDPRIAIVAPRVEQPEGRLKVTEAGRVPDLRRMTTHWTGASRMASRLPWLEGTYLLAKSAHKPRTVDWVSGACMLVRGDSWRELGGLSERWFMYAEDIEFCLRARDRGHVVQLESTALAHHLMGRSSNTSERSTPERTRARDVRSDWIINLYDLYSRRPAVGPVHRLLWKVVCVGGLISRVAVYWIKARSSSGADRTQWDAESLRFLIFARDLARARRGNG